MSPQTDLVSYLQLLAGADAGSRLFEIRFSLPDGGMGNKFVPAIDVHRAARMINGFADRHDVYVGVALRRRRAGGRDALTDCHLTFVEIDSPDAAERIHRFRHRPTILVSSGTPGHLHAYWRLQTPATPDQIEQTNRCLAHHLGADPASVDSPRILRPPATLNHKHSPPAEVKLIALDDARSYTPAELTAGLPDPSHTALSRPRRTPRAATHPLDQPLLTIPAEHYVRALAHLEPNRAGKITCPFHDDHTPSLQLYEHNHSWYCFACRIGGSIYDFAARLWNTGTKGQDFLALRARLTAELLNSTRRPSS